MTQCHACWHEFFTCVTNVTLCDVWLWELLANSGKILFVSCDQYSTERKKIRMWIFYYVLHTAIQYSPAVKRSSTIITFFQTRLTFSASSKVERPRLRGQKTKKQNSVLAVCPSFKVKCSIKAWDQPVTHEKIHRHWCHFSGEPPWARTDRKMKITMLTWKRIILILMQSDFLFTMRVSLILWKLWRCVHALRVFCGRAAYTRKSDRRACPLILFCVWFWLLEPHSWTSRRRWT